jgi:hypothetical protein
VSAGCSHGEELAAAGDDASGHGKPFLERRGESLPEGFGIDASRAQGSNKVFLGRSGGGPIIGSRKTGE